MSSSTSPLSITHQITPETIQTQQSTKRLPQAQIIFFMYTSLLVAAVSYKLGMTGPIYPKVFLTPKVVSIPSEAPQTGSLHRFHSCYSRLRFYAQAKSCNVRPRDFSIEAMYVVSAISLIAGLTIYSMIDTAYRSSVNTGLAVFVIALSCHRLQIGDMPYEICKLTTTSVDSTDFPADGPRSFPSYSDHSYKRCITFNSNHVAVPPSTRLEVILDLNGKQHQYLITSAEKLAYVLSRIGRTFAFPGRNFRVYLQLPPFHQ